ncbi:MULTISPECIES: TolC family protein [Rhodanobacteraceae]|jgi:outer membrane protein TolC|uniref:Heavy metal RND efflux outer membrane protein, CzcC family n=1 Tax=Aerosticca soli TaxID=2010829 RepID=A0A2Z6E361_9GAMM|nr:MULTISPECIES: TolC family protein [Rhodanobacteraceae]ODV27228.1 MAG: transporter [Rhodanobacter sp. SCN 68-63]OJY61703.1 MAG: transporter [Rhodanobacter sp. 68-29]BBD79191.1 heavy metal RND efflux outer membrane protein, CzcC family [Aerosticca soli]
MFSRLLVRRLMPGLFLCVFAAALTPRAHADDAQPLTLDQAVRLGTQRAPLLDSRDAEIAASRDDAVRAGRLPDPVLSFGVANYPVSSPGAFSLRSDGMTMRTVGVMQAIPSRAARQAEKNAAAAGVEAAQADRLALAKDVRQQVAEAWIETWVARKRLDLLHALQEESDLAVRMARARLRGGEGGATDALAARAEQVALANRIDAARAGLDRARASLARWLAPPQADAPLADPPDFTRLPVPLPTLQREVDRQAPMQPWQAREQQAQAALDQAKASLHPDWSVNLMYGQRAPRLSNMVTLQVGVSLPLFTRNRQDRAVSARQEARDAVQFAREDARRAQHEAVARTAADWQGWNRQVARDREVLLPLARDRARVALAAYRGGGALQPWLDARRDDIQLLLDYTDALAAQARNWAALAYLLPAAETAP